MARVLGVDLGSRRIGLAISDPGRVIASPLRVLERTGDDDADRAAIVAAAREEEADTIVIGLPTEMSGRKGTAARAAEGERLAIATLVPDLTVDLVDERMTTVIAQRALVGAGVRRRERRQQVDKVAAAVLLQSYLDARR